MHVSSDYFPKKKRKEKKGNLPPPQKTLSVFTLSRATEIKVVLFCKMLFWTADGKSKSFSHLELEIKTSCSKWNVSRTCYKNWHDQIKQCHYFRHRTSALSINNSELQFLGILSAFKIRPNKRLLMGALDFNLWSREESSNWSSSIVYWKISIPNLLCSPPSGNNLISFLHNLNRQYSACSHLQQTTDW